MYFWKIDRLKADLSKGPLSQSEQFKYLFASSILYGLAVLPFFSNNWFDVLSWALGVVVIGIGTYYFYFCNGGRDGKRLLERYTSLSWVFLIRFSILVATPVYIVFYTCSYWMGKSSSDTDIPDVIITIIMECVFCFLLGRHVRDVAKHATKQAQVDSQGTRVLKNRGS